MWRDVATIVSAKGLNGGLSMRSHGDLPFLLEKGDKVHLAPPVIDSPRHVEVIEVSPTGAGKAVVLFSGIDSKDVAQSIVGCHCIVKDSKRIHDILDAQGIGLSYIGWKVIDAERGFIGTIEDERAGFEQVLLTVRSDSGRGILIPLADDLVDEIDEANLSLNLRCPNGIFDL